MTAAGTKRRWSGHLHGTQISQKQTVSPPVDLSDIFRIIIADILERKVLFGSFATVSGHRSPCNEAKGTGLVTAAYWPCARS